MNEKVIIISSMEEGLYFFTTDHCQEHGLNESYIPITYKLPMHVEPREGLPSGIIKNVDDLVEVFYDDMEEIANPKVKYQQTFITTV